MNERKILIVDDEAHIREILEMAFSKAGYSVHSVSSGEEALGILRQELIPVIYIDLGLETMTGFELCERIRKDNPETIIYALTGYASLFHHREYLEAGFNDYFAKPVKLDLLFKSARDAFEKLERLANETSPIAIKRILIIDDDEGFRKMLRGMLESEGYEITEAHDGEQGVKCQHVQPADLIITDIVMPRKEGIETILDIQRISPEVKIIVVSGGGGVFSEIQFDIARNLGVRTLAKPFRRKDILSMIDEIRQSK